MRSTAAARASIAVLAALALVSCAQPGAEPTVAPDGPPPSASASASPTAAPSASASSAAVARLFEAQDGAVRFELPAGWSVDDRSAMGEASEMYDRGPGWLNDLVVLDEDGDQMLWYREEYGNDFVDCRLVRAGALEVEIEPFSTELAAGGAQSVILAEVAEASEWDARAQPGAWSVAMGVVARSAGAEGGCSDLTPVMWTGSRVVMIDVVGDADDESGMPDVTIDFPDEQSARAWLESAEHDAIVDVLASLELTDAPVLDAAP